MQHIILTSLPLETFITAIKETITAELERHYSHPAKIQSGGDLVTRKDAANLLGVSLPTLSEWTKDGIIKGYRIASRVRYNRTELHKALIPIKSIKSQENNA